MKFPPGNKIYFGQDHNFFIGIPNGIDFEVEKPYTFYELTACGYGCMEHEDCYGCGSLVVFPHCLTEEERKRLDEASKGEKPCSDGS